MTLLIAISFVLLLLLVLCYFYYLFLLSASPLYSFVLIFSAIYLILTLLIKDYRDLNETAYIWYMLVELIWMMSTLTFIFFKLKHLYIPLPIVSILVSLLLLFYIFFIHSHSSKW